MKVIRMTLYVFSYIFQYLMPIMLFGFVVPYFRGQKVVGLTGVGVIAFCLVLALTYGKIQKKIDKNVSGIWHGILLSIVPIIAWVAMGLGIQRLLNFVHTLVDYWWIAFIFIILGRICFTVADTMEELDG